MTAKADPEDYAGRIREISSDPCNEQIHRVDRAGEIMDGHLVTHNGLLVKPADSGYVRLLQGNAGCHEPQEEFLFQEVLKQTPAGGTILELGAYWGFYSMWFAKEVPDARCLLVEPKRSNLKLGQTNFAKNGLKGKFFCHKIGHGYLGVDQFLGKLGVEYLDLLHADIQGAEVEMLRDAEEVLANHRVGHVVIGTHGQDLHYQCKAILEHYSYITVAHADFDYGTTCCDGVLVACRPDLEGLDTIDLPLRDPDGQSQAEREMRDLAVDIHKSGRMAGWLKRFRIR